MTDERVCRTCARSMFTAKRRADAECEAYDLLVWCRREPMRARRVEPHPLAVWSRDGSNLEIHGESMQRLLNRLAGDAE